MSEHLTSQEVTAWRSGVTDPADILRLDDHLAECEKCRVLISGGLSDGIRALQAEFSPAHLTESQLDDYAAHRPLPADVMQHLDSCLDCRADADDLRKFAEPRQSSTGWLYPIAAMIALTALGLTAWLADRHRTASPVQTPIEIASSIPPQYQTEVNAALESGTLHIPAAISGMATAPIQLRSSGSDQPKPSQPLRTVSPLATAVVPDIPTLRWTPIEGATYTVTIYDDQFRGVATGTALKNNEWHPEKPLARGATYRWEVRAVSGTHVDRAPAPTDPEARFTVLSADDAKKLTDALATMPNERIALGILLANMGAVEEARREFSIAAEGGNPKQRSDAQRLLNQLK